MGLSVPDAAGDRRSAGIRPRRHDRQPFIYPMFVFAAHTGARRSEMVRSEIDDIDFAGATVLIREKKRVRGKLSTRRVPLSPLLVRVMRDWIDNHPGGRYTFALGATLPVAARRGTSARKSPVTKRTTTSNERSPGASGRRFAVGTSFATRSAAIVRQEA